MSSYLSIFLLLLIVLRYIFWLFAPPNPDEAYYWLWGQHLDFSYYDHPPLQAWLYQITKERQQIEHPV
jgi:4-amino-4-deoxy-L-arabinose transferase-like glycosyltransferase